MSRRPTLATVPALAAEFDLDANGRLTPEDITLGSARAVWWTCAAQGHQWLARVDTRARGKWGCPMCQGREATRTNNVAVTHPRVAAMWHPTRNGSEVPTDVVAGSKRIVWWLCGTCRYEWTSSVVARSTRPECPACAGWVLTAATSLAAVAPGVAAEWHPTRNGDFTAGHVTSRSLKKVWWLCAACGHEWCVDVRSRFVRGTGCAECANSFPRRAIDPVTVTHPRIAAEWHPTLNGAARPEQVTAGSARVAWWHCATCGHDWQTKVTARTGGTGYRSRRGTGCPVCSGHRFTERTSLSRTDPRLAAQWHPTANGSLTASSVTAGSGRMVWWLCATCRHSWCARVASRSAGSGCPECGHRATRAAAQERRLRPSYKA